MTLTQKIEEFRSVLNDLPDDMAVENARQLFDKLFPLNMGEEPAVLQRHECIRILARCNAGTWRLYSLRDVGDWEIGDLYAVRADSTLLASRWETKQEAEEAICEKGQRNGRLLIRREK